MSAALAVAAPALAQRAPRAQGAPADAVRVRTLDNGVRVVIVRRPSAPGVGLALRVDPASTSGSPPRAAPRVEEGAGTDPRCARAGILSRGAWDRGAIAWVGNAPTRALELALWCHAQRLSRGAPGADPSALGPTDLSRVVLALVLPEEPADLDAMLGRTLGALVAGDARPSPPSARAPEPPEPSGWRPESGRESEQTVGWTRAFAVAPARTPDHYALVLLTRVLAGGPRSRVARFAAERGISGVVVAESYVEQRPLAQDQLRLTLRYAAPRAGRPSLATIGDALLSVLARDGVTGSELAAARARWRAEWIAGQSSPDDAAARYAAFESIWGNARLALTEADRFDAVTVQDVLRVVHGSLLGAGAPR